MSKFFQTNKNARRLEIIDPEVTHNSINIDNGRMVQVKDSGAGFKADGVIAPIQKRDEGEFAGKAFYLNNTFDWEFGYDSFGLLIIVPLKRKGMYEHAGPIGGMHEEGIHEEDN